MNSNVSKMCKHVNTSVIPYLSLKIDFVSANSVDPYEMPHYATFHLGVRCLPKYEGRPTNSWTFRAVLKP